MSVKKVAVIGAGKMGRLFALEAARAGYQTILEDVSQGRIDQAVSWIRESLEATALRGQASGSAGTVTKRKALPKNLSTASGVEEAIRDADLILEALPDEMEMKVEMFTIFDKFAKPEAILASCTASLSVSDLAEVTFCAERCIGMRFAKPESENAIELVRGRETSSETVAQCSEVVRRMHKNVHVVFAA